MDHQMGEQAFWDNNERAQKHIGKLNSLKRAVLPVVAFQKKVDDIGVMQELVEAASAGEREAYEKEIEDSVATMVTELDQLEIASFLTGCFRQEQRHPLDPVMCPTESNDWADILFRMYSRWAERRGYSMELQDVQAGHQAGISKATILIKGEKRLRLCEGRARRAPSGADQSLRREQAAPYLILRRGRDRRDHGRDPD